MKQKTPSLPCNVAVSESETVFPTRTTSEFDWLRFATPLKRQAKAILNDAGAQHRLTLILGLVMVLGAALAVPMMLECLLLLSELLTVFSSGENVVWPTVLYYVLNGLILLLITMPLVAAWGRMAILITDNHGKPVSTPTTVVGIGELLYPFTSREAYLRTLYVALRGLGCLLATVLPPAGLIFVAKLWLPMISQNVPLIVYNLLWVLHIGVACLLLLTLALLTCRMAGLAYFVFSAPERSLKDIRQDFVRCRRPCVLPLWLPISFLGWIVVSVLAVFVPLVLHTAPYMLLAWASYGKCLKEVHQTQGEEVDTPSELPSKSTETETSAEDIEWKGDAEHETA